MSDHDLLAEQRAYYRSRAPSYDEWWQRRGPYDRGDEETADWVAQIAEVEAALAAFDPRGDVLELAGGTGWWTERLARTAERLTVVDASPETVALNRKRVGRADVDYLLADLFEWRPERQYDVVFFSFWLSHVPRARFSGFWRLVGDCLKPGGRAFLIDSRTGTGKPGGDPYVTKYEADIHRRTLNEGGEFRVVKVLYQPDELAGLLAAEGWEAAMSGTRWFVFGSAAARPGPASANSATATTT